MKWQRFATSMKLSKLLKGLMTLALIKLALLGMVGWQIEFPTGKGKAVVRVQSTPPAQAQEAAPAPAPAPKPAAPAGMANNGSMQSSQAQPLDLNALLERQENLDRRERELNALQEKITQDMATLEERRAQLERMLDDAKAVKDKKDRHLVDVFSNMKAKQAAQVLETMDERQAVKILSGMRGRQAGEILTFVNAEKAARLAEALTRLQIPFE